MRYAALWEADLRSANIHNTNLRVAGLHGSDLSEADLSGADLWRAYLGGVDLSGAILEDALFLDGTDLRGVKGLTREQLETCKARGAIIDEDPTASSS